MKNHLLSWLSVGLLLTACSTPQMQVDQTLARIGNVYDVSGRNGWLVNQQLRFGEFRTDAVRRSWTKGYDFPFIVRFTGAKEKLSFTLNDASGNTAEVFCLGKLREQDLTLFHQYFDINLKVADAFTGTIAVNGSTAYDFFVTNLNQNNWFREAEGWVRGEGKDIYIRPVEHLANAQRSLAMQVPGFEFVLDGQVIGAVETLNRGRIWLRNDLDTTQRLVLSGLASALLLRSDLAEHNDQLS